jgi:hypothetical protein
VVLPKKIIQILIPPVTIPRSTVKPVLRDQPLLGDPFKNSQLFINYVKYHFEIAFVLKDHMCKICQISQERLYCIVKRQLPWLLLVRKNLVGDRGTTNST